MENNLGAIGWQLGLFGLICLDGVVSYWAAKQYRRWLIRRLEEPRNWVMLSSVFVGLITFAFLAVSLGFFMDTAASV